MTADPLRILNLMHDKVDTQLRFTKVLSEGPYNVDVQYFYPQTHYTSRPVPDLVQEISQPLDLKQVATMDAFIITGAPIEQLTFEKITYLDEIHQLIDVLVTNNLYDIPKFQLPEKIFGVFHNYLRAQDPLLKGLPDGFLAPHARYAELDIDKIMKDPRLVINAVTKNNFLFSFRAREKNQYFLFSHLEYGKDALLKEYLRERNANPLHMKDPEFSWATTQRVFFDNWLHSVADHIATQQFVKE